MLLSSFDFVLVKNLQGSEEVLLISIEVTGLFNIICYS